MNEAQNTKKVLVVAPAVKDNAAFTILAPVNTLGFGYLEMLFAVGVTDVIIGESGTTNPPVLEECDTDSGTAGDWSEIPNAELAAVIPATGDNKLYQIDVNLMNSTRKKFIRPKVPTAGDGTTGAAMAVIGILSKPQIGPTSAAERGLQEHVIV